MDLRRLRVGDVIAGIAACALLGVMFVKWYGFEGAEGARREFDRLQGLGLPGDEVDRFDRILDAAERSAWEAFTLIDVFLAVAALAGIVLVVLALTQRSAALPVAAAAITALLGILATVLVLFRIAFLPDVDFGDLVGGGGGAPAEGTTRAAGVYVGLAATIGIAVGAWLSMRDDSPGPSEASVNGSGPVQAARRLAAPDPAPRAEDAS